MARIVRYHRPAVPRCYGSKRWRLRRREGEVRIAVKAIGLNRAESMYRQGLHPEAPTLPSRLGTRRGTVDAVGAGSPASRSGTASARSPFFHGEVRRLRDSAVVPSDAVTSLPGNLSFEEGPPSGCRT